MDPDVRAAVAFIAGALIGDAQASAVHDHGRGIDVSLTADVRDTYLGFYDYLRSCPISGARTKDDVTLFDYGTNSEIVLRINGARFSGVENGTGAHFSGEVKDSSIALVDDGAHGTFQYTLR